MLQNPIRPNLQKTLEQKGCLVPTRKIVKGMILHVNILSDWERKSIQVGERKSKFVFLTQTLVLPICILASTIQCHAMTLILQAFSSSKTILNYNIFHIFPCKKVSLKKKKTCILQWLTCHACLALLQFVIKNQKRKLNILCKSILTSRCTLRKPNTSMFANSQKRSKFKQYITINLKKLLIT